MQVSRRDVLRVAGVAAVGAAGLSLPLGRGVSGSTISLLPTSRMPKPYAVPFVRQSLLQRRLGLCTVSARSAAGVSAYEATDLAAREAVWFAIQAAPGLLEEFVVPSTPQRRC